jgi:hypothetical protein
LEFVVVVVVLMKLVEEVIVDSQVDSMKNKRIIKKNLFDDVLLEFV